MDHHYELATVLGISFVFLQFRSHDLTSVLLPDRKKLTPLLCRLLIFWVWAAHRSA